MPDDENQPATKSDLKSLRDELKGDIARLDDRVQHLDDRVQHLDGKTDKIWSALVDTQGRMEKMEQRLTNVVKAGYSKIMENLADLTDREKDNRRSILVFDKILAKHGSMLEDHETRLTELES